MPGDPITPATTTTRPGDATTDRLEERPPAGASGGEPASHLGRRLGAVALAALPTLLLLLPGALTVYLGFNAGGFFVGDVAVAALVVVVALVGRLTLADRPFGGFTPLGAVAALALAAFALWVLLSGGWSDSTARSLVEFDRALLYLLTLVLFTTVAPTHRRADVMLWGFVAGGAVVCLAGLGSRVLPGVVHTTPTVSSERLSYPLTYWNALGLLAALTIIASAHLTTSERQPRVVRVVGAALAPAVVVTLYFTFSRGAIAACVIGLVLYVLLARPRALATGLLAALPASAVAVVVAYGADRLAAKNPTAHAASGQAHRVALVTGLAMAAAALLRIVLLPVDARLARLAPSPRTRRLAAGATVAVLAIAALGTAVAIDAPSRISHQYDRFVKGANVEDRGDVRNRLTDPANNGRLQEWNVALDGYRTDRLKGTGAGTYSILWARHRPISFGVNDGHSLYLETLAEMGLVGLGLLALALLGVLAAIARRVRGPDRAIYAALLAMAVAFLLHAGVDWDWEMPVLTLWLFAFGGLLLGRPDAERAGRLNAGRLPRVGAGLACLVLAVIPGLLFVSQRQLDASDKAFKRGDCPRAIDRALASNSVLSVRPEPLELIGYCDVRLGQPRLAVDALRSAVDRDPDNWQLHYGLALVRGAAGMDPRPQLRTARRLNPREKTLRIAAVRFRKGGAARWRRAALRSKLPLK